MDKTNKNVQVDTYFRFSSQAGFLRVMLVNQENVCDFQGFCYLLMRPAPKLLVFNLNDQQSGPHFQILCFPKLGRPGLSVIRVTVTFQNFPGC